MVFISSEWFRVDGSRTRLTPPNLNPLEHQNLTQGGAASAVRLSIVASLAICTFMLLVIGVEQVTFEDIFETTLHIPVLPAMTSVFYFAGGAHHAMMGNPDREIETVRRLPTSLRSVCPPLRRIHSTTYEQPQPCCVQRVRNRHVLGELLVRPAVLHTVPKESDYV